MELAIFNVGQAFCALLTADNGNTVLFDCGCNDDLGFRPSKVLPALGVTSLQELIITNFDDDHVRDLHNLRETVGIDILIKNPSLPAQTLAQMKLSQGPLTKGLQSLTNMMGSYTNNEFIWPDLAGIKMKAFWNTYPTFTDTNSLSLVTFIEYDGLSILIPGDLTAKGWQGLLRVSEFREHLGRVNVFVASHHGREDGYCPEVFEHCHPDLVIISDGPIQYDSQEHCYDDQASGISWPQDGPNSIRYVLTTRRDGTILFNKSPGQQCLVRTVDINSLFALGVGI